MALIFTKIALAVGLGILTLGLYPDKGLRGGILAVAIVIVAAIILHFVAP
jgi:hypothetical protein